MTGNGKMGERFKDEVPGRQGGSWISSAPTISGREIVRHPLFMLDSQLVPRIHFSSVETDFAWTSELTAGCMGRPSNRSRVASQKTYRPNLQRGARLDVVANRR